MCTAKKIKVSKQKWGVNYVKQSCMGNKIGNAYILKRNTEKTRKHHLWKV